MPLSPAGRELGNEIVCKWKYLKISQKVGSDIQQFPTFEEEKKPGTVSRSLRQVTYIISQLTGAKVSRMSQAYSQAIRHGVSMCSELYFQTFFLT